MNSSGSSGDFIYKGVFDSVIYYEDKEITKIFNGFWTRNYQSEECYLDGMENSCGQGILVDIFFQNARILEGIIRG